MRKVIAAFSLYLQKSKASRIVQVFLFFSLIFLVLFKNFYALLVFFHGRVYIARRCMYVYILLVVNCKSN